MQKMMKKALTSAVASALLVSSSVGFADPTLKIGNFSITGGGVSLVGAVSTTVGDNTKNKAMTYVGWTLIVVGVLVNGGYMALGAEAAEVSVSAADVWSAMLREAKVLAKNPDLIKEDSSIASAAKAMGISALALANLVVDLDKGASSEQLKKKYFGGSFENLAQEKAFDNLVALNVIK